MNEYRVTISFGDGNPKTTTVSAKNGSFAQDEAFKLYPAARSVHVLGAVSLHKEEEHVVAPYSFAPNVYGCDLIPQPQKKKKIVPVLLENNQVNPMLLEAVRLRKEGVSQRNIAEALGISRGVVRRLLNANID